MKSNYLYSLSTLCVSFFVILASCKSSPVVAENNSVKEPVKETVKEVEKEVEVKLEEVYPVQKIKAAKPQVLATFPLFPEGPSYRKSDGSYFFAGNNGLSRVTKEGEMHVLIEKPGGGGTHILPDGSILLIGAIGLRRVYPDGKIALLSDGAKTGKGNDITMGIDGTVYWSVPSKGVYRLESGKDKKPELIVDKKGLNGLDVDPSGEYLFICRGRRIVKHKILGTGKKLGSEELVYEFQDRNLGGADGCTFDAYGNFWLMHFKSGIISVIDPAKKDLVIQKFSGTKPATNMAFCGPDYRDLMITAGAPKFKNCKVKLMKLDLQGFKGHPGVVDYSMIKYLDEKIDPKKFQ